MQLCNQCDNLGVHSPYDPNASQMLYLCRRHYLTWSNARAPRKHQLSAGERLRARLAWAEIDAELQWEPTELQKSMEEEEIRQEEEKIVPALLDMFTKLNKSD